MRIATYNIWNENKGVGNRFEQIISEIKSTDADIIGLQEVTPYFYENYISKNEDYKYNCFYQYTNELEGLAILSRYPIENNFS